MMTEGMIETCGPPAGEKSSDSRRRYYRITSYGRTVARAEAERLYKLTLLARERYLLARGTR